MSYFILMIGLFGLYNRKNIIKEYWILFPIFLIVLALLDTLGGFFNRAGIGVFTQKLYYQYLVIPFQFLFYFLWYSYHLNTKKSLTLTLISIYLFSFFVDHYFQSTNQHFWFSTFAYLVGTMVLIYFLYQYYHDLTESDKILVYYKDPLFWISIGLLIGRIGNIPYYGLYNLLNARYPDFLHSTYMYIVVALQYLQYIMFFIAIKWLKKEN